MRITAKTEAFVLGASSAWREIVFYWGYTKFYCYDYDCTGGVGVGWGRKTMKVEV